MLSFIHSLTHSFLIDALTTLYVCITPVGGHLLQVCAPLLDMTRSWVYEGVLQDPYKEFFVVPCGGGGSSAAASTGNGAVQRDGWRDCWRLEPAKLPPFVPAGLATTILRAGKSLNFLRDACGDGAWTSAWAPGAVRAAAGLGYAQVSGVWWLAYVVVVWQQ